MSHPMLSVVIPCHNEAPHIAGLLERTSAAFADVSHEVIVVADGCTDGTEDVVLDVMETHPNVRLLRNDPRLGKGGAIRRGILDARGDSIGFIDGDGEIDPAYLRKAFSALESHKKDIVIGNRYGAGGSYHTTVMRHITSRVYQTAIWVLFGLHLHDTQAGLKVFRANVAKHLFAISDVDGYAFDIDVLTHAHWQGYSMEEIPMSQRFKGTSTISFPHVLEMIMDTCGTYDRHVREMFSRRSTRASAGWGSFLHSTCFYPFTAALEFSLGIALGAKK